MVRRQAKLQDPAPLRPHSLTLPSRSALQPKSKHPGLRKRSQVQKIGIRFIFIHPRGFRVPGGSGFPFRASEGHLFK